MLDELHAWAEHNGCGRIDDFRGKLSRLNIRDPFIFSRNQYIDILLNQEPIIRQRNI